MNKFPLIFLFLSLLYSSQSKQFVYEYKFIPDSTIAENVITEMMILDIGKDRSEYFSFAQYNSDSTLLADSKKGLMTMPPNKEMIYDRIIKTPNSNQIMHIKRLVYDRYNIKQEINFKWELINEFSNILDHKVQKATSEFGGRKWIAWFSPDIPIQDGPYKFKDLPGLIFKVEDEKQNHIFELKGIKNNETAFIYPDVKNYREVNVTFPQYVKVYQNYRKNPANLIGRIPDQRNADGKFRTGTEIIREIEKNLLERIRRDNNIIEIDLLK